MKTIKTQLMYLPTPTTISIFWNLGFMMSMILLMQIITGLFLSFHYLNDSMVVFKCISHILRDTNYGWLLKLLHANGASMFFMFMYIHIFRGFFFQSYKKKTWYMGVTILLLSMLTAFMGYVLPWGQMSYWGTTVITNLVSSIPYIGNMIVTWLWGGPSVNAPTLNRFYSLHFILPFILMFLVILHLLMLHHTGSKNPMNMKNTKDMLMFHTLFSMKDLICLFIFFLFITTFLISPNILMDPENYNISDPLLTPTHIQPEWYFLFVYTILRSIPNKFGGVMALMMSILILYLLPLFKSKENSPQNITNTMLVLMLFMTIIILTWIGMKPVMFPFDLMGKIFSIFYFLLIFLLMIK